jgi:hypothetical protein
MAYYEACLTTISMNEPFSIVPPPELAQPWLSDNYTVREIRAAGAMAVSPSEAEQAFATPWSSSTTNSSPITPPPELVTSLCNSVPHQLQAALEALDA